MSKQQDSGDRLEPIGEMRRFERLSTGPEYGVSLEFQGRAVEEATLQNLSACGCGVKVPRAQAEDLEMGSRLQRVYLVHPELPFVPLDATIVRVLGRTQGGREGWVLLGLDFVYVTPTVQLLIQTHVVEQLRGEG